MEPNWTQYWAKSEQFGPKMDAEWVWNSFGIRGESFGNSYGIRLELICKSDGWFGNVLGMHRGCWGMSVEFIGNYYESFGKQLVFIGNPWDISGDFWLGIHSLGEVQVQTEHIHTRAIFLAKPRFPFHLLTGVLICFSRFLVLFLLHFWDGF